MVRNSLYTHTKHYYICDFKRQECLNIINTPLIEINDLFYRRLGKKRLVFRLEEISLKKYTPQAKKKVLERDV